MEETRALRSEPAHIRNHHAFLSTLCEHVTHSIAVTIQPNFAYAGSERSVRHASTGSRTLSSDRLKELAKEEFYRLDRGYSGCPKPHYLPPHWRFDGIVIPEGYRTNPHAHIVISCRNRIEQLRRYLFLLWALNNVPAKTDPKARLADIANEESAWKILGRGRLPWMAWNEEYSQGRFLTGAIGGKEPLAPAGTAKVQLIKSRSDLENVLVYNTKYWDSHARSLRSAPTISADDYEYDLWRLAEWFSPLGIENPARCHRIDPNNPEVHLPTKGMREWRIRGGKVLR